MFHKFAAKFPCTPLIIAGHVENWPQVEKILYTNVEVNSVALSSDGKCIACGLDDGIIQVWDMDTGKVLCTPLQGHTTYVMSVAFSLDGQCIVSGSWDETVQVWDVKTGEALGTPLQGHTDYVQSVTISPDRKHIVSGLADTTIWVWDMETGEAFGVPLQGHTESIQSITVSPDGKCIVSCLADRTIWVWDTLNVFYQLQSQKMGRALCLFQQMRASTCGMWRHWSHQVLVSKVALNLFCLSQFRQMETALCLV
jgi:WD40 repeat protein